MMSAQGSLSLSKTWDPAYSHPTYGFDDGCKNEGRLYLAASIGSYT